MLSLPERPMWSEQALPSSATLDRLDRLDTSSRPAGAPNLQILTNTIERNEGELPGCGGR